MVAKDIFPFATVTESCEEVNFVGFSFEYGIWDTTFWKFSQKNVDFFEKFHEINILATISHGLKEENILCNHYSWLQKRDHFISYSSR